MKRPYNFFIYIAVLAAGLMALIAVAQIITQKNIARLEEGNNRSALTFNINNRLQENINLAFDLENKINKEGGEKLLMPGRGFKDSLYVLGYNMTALKELWPGALHSEKLNELVNLVNRQESLSFALLAAAENKNTALQKTYADSLRNGNWSGNIYSAAVAFQKSLEQNLGNTLQQNNSAAAKASTLNRLLAGVSLLAIMVLATIIIRRQVKQLRLIKDLEVARKAALESAEAKDQFLANMSHEIRTPLNAIRGFGRILLQTPLNAEQRNYSTIISTASDNLLNIVNDILDFSKIEAGNVVLFNRPFSLYRQFDEMQKLFAPLADEKKLKLLITKSAEVPDFINGDPQRLRQIFVNLISNAIKFTGEGRVHLHTSVIKLDVNKASLLFQVSDTGMGIPADKTDIIFDRFEQVDHSYSRQQGGTGLGLAITKRLAEAMGGSIKVKSEPGRGSVFSVQISFPVEKEEAVANEEQNLIINGDSAVMVNKKILVAEDNKMNQLLVQNILEKYGVIAEMADNGEQAVQYLTDNAADLVLMDVQMPGLDGISATEIIRKKLNISTPVIAMTAHVLPGEKEKCIAAGMTDYISKPIDEAVFIATIGKHLPVNNIMSDTGSRFAEHEWLNMQYLDTVCNGNPQKAKLILTELAASLADDTIILQKAAETTSEEQLKMICHHLKSTLSLVKKDAPPVIHLEQLARGINSGYNTTKIRGDAQKLISSLEALRNKIFLMIETGA